jgi:hypothetical protein
MANSSPPILARRSVDRKTPQGGGDVAQDLVAEHVAEAVVDGFETVEVEIEQAESLR